MKFSLQQLSTDEVNYLDLMFLARFAPRPGETPPAVDSVDGVFPQYNHELSGIIQSLGINTTSCRDMDEFIDTVKNYNFVFSIYNRFPMRNCEVFPSSVCEYFHVPYLGAPPNIRILAEDKYLTKALASSLGIPVPPGKALHNLEQIDDNVDFQGPYFIKPRFGAASEEISSDSIQADWCGAVSQITYLLNKNKECLVERCIPGTDITVPVLGGNPPIILPPMHEISELSNGIVTYKQKRCIEEGRTRVPFRNKEKTLELERYVSLLCKHLLPFDYLRVDFRLQEETEKLFLLEFNVCCNLGSHAAIAQSASESNISHKDVVNHIICHSLRRQHGKKEQSGPGLSKHNPNTSVY